MHGNCAALLTNVFSLLHRKVFLESASVSKIEPFTKFPSLLNADRQFVLCYDAVVKVKIFLYILDFCEILDQLMII